MSDDWKTRRTLLARAMNQDDQKAWDEFVIVYKRFIYYIFNKFNSIPARDMDDLVQDALVKIWQKLPVYDPEKGKFRAWLSVMLRNMALNYIRSLNNKQSKEVSIENENGATMPLPDISESEIDEMIENDWKLYITDLAFEKMENLFSANSIQILTLSLQGMSNQEISKKLDLKVDSVKVLKHRIRGRFMQEVQHLVEELETK